MDETFVPSETVRTDGVCGRLFHGLGDGPHPGVLVLHGGGGARGYEGTYAAMLAEHGYTVCCVEYFGAPGTRDALVDVPLEEFRDAADWLLDRPDVAGDRVGVVGFSRGGEASLVVGARFDAFGAVVAYVPSCFRWQGPSWMAGVGPNQPTWTLDGDPLPYLRIEKHVATDEIDDPLGNVGPNPPRLALERASAAERDAAAIPVERIEGPVLLVSGGRDTLWPSAEMASRAAARLANRDHPWRVEHLENPDAGHAIRVPYRFDGTTDPTATHEFGGTNAANARAATRAWQRTLSTLARL
ncbi:acyl-CoA thioester hydrolase/BAAT C-terminal domain-containing protein [Halovivax cerinus]|uniref:Acyl-CoA thioester hydrolase/BAAT C-terminal domain-containing protein n=1 Tax=Halovivax cerinus TaxID=1487865 RepID=A0ABD5NMG0_9EURY|nr:acyl-CoA thioester hydrolase/BAAT C-terminal domain-containing protein [Halovivax cerinus]